MPGPDRTWSDQDLVEAHKDARSLRQILLTLGLCINGGNSKTIKKYLAKLELPLPKVIAIPPSERAKQYRERHPEKVKKSFKEYQIKNLDKFAQYARNRRALQAGAEGSFTLEEFKALCDSCGNVCLSCGSSEKLTVDHVLPLSKGGSNSIENIQPLCGLCNSKKKDHFIDYRR